MKKQLEMRLARGVPTPRAKPIDPLQLNHELEVYFTRDCALALKNPSQEFRSARIQFDGLKIFALLAAAPRSSNES